MKQLPFRVGAFCHRGWSIAAFCVALVSFTAAASAADAGPESSPSVPQQNGASTTELAEVVVTAQKREENARSIPLSISAVSAEDLASNHIQNFADLTRAVPNLSFSSLGGEGLSNLEIRGISSQAGTATVAVYLDDVSLTTRNLYTGGAAEPRIFDLDRVEVLRGPQGTLYGASALGGTIKFVTVQPILNEFHGEAFTEGSSVSGGGANWDVRGIVNLPLVTDRVALRLGVERGVDSGYITAVPLAGYSNVGISDAGPASVPDSNRNDWTVAKGALLFKVNDDINVKAAIFYQRYNSDSTDLVDLDSSGYVASKGLTEPSTDELAVPSLTLSWDAGIGDLTAVTGFYQRKFDRTNDVTLSNVGDGILVSLLPSPPITPAQTQAQAQLASDDLKSADYLDTKVNQVSEEIRFASKAYAEGDAVPITWIAGGFFSDERTYISDTQPIFGINAAFNSVGESPSNPAFLSGAFPNDFTNDLSYYAWRNYGTTQYAGFGEATYHFGSAVRFTAGVRYLKAREVFDRLGEYYYSACDPSVTPDSTCPATAHVVGYSHATTPKFALDWDLNPAVTLYANITNGFRLGSENRPVPFYGPSTLPIVGGVPQGNSTNYDLKTLGLTSVPLTYAPDSLWNYEIGTKSLLFEKRVSVDMSVFYIRWKNIQQDIDLLTSGYDFEANAGNAKSYGFEVATKARVTEHITVDASGGYTKATLDSGVVINGQTVNNTFAGEDVAGVPRWSGTFGVEDTFNIGEVIAFVRGGANYVGKSHGTLVTTDPDYNRPDYTVFNASAGFTLDRYEFSLFAKNLANNQEIIQRPDIQNAGANLGYRLVPRIIGANVRITF